MGYSYTENGNYTTGDNAVAVDNLNFMVGFLEQYPEFKDRPFYIAGGTTNVRLDVPPSSM